MVLRAIGEYSDAVDSASRALDTSRQVLDQRLIAESTNALGNAYRKLGELSKADVLLSQALTEVELTGQQHLSSVYRIILGKVCLQRKEFTQALELFVTAEGELKESNATRRVAESKIYQAATHYKMNQPKICVWNAGSPRGGSSPPTRSMPRTLTSTTCSNVLEGSPSRGDL